MAITRAENQITWSASNSVSVSAAGSQTSDLVTLDTTCINAAITVKADNAGTPAAGDTVDYYWASSVGDPDGAATAEYPTDTLHMQWLCRIDTNSTDADKNTVSLPAVPANGYLVAVSNASSNSITVSGTIEELRAA